MVPGSTTLTTGPLNTVVVGAVLGVPGMVVVVVVDDAGTDVVVVLGTTVVTVPVAVRGNLPDTN